MRFVTSLLPVCVIVIIGLTCAIDPLGPDTSLPEILVDPQPVTIDVGKTATFGVIAKGKKPFIYRWQKNHTDIPGGTDSSYTTSITGMEDNGAKFRCIVSNTTGTDTSSDALLAVYAVKPRIISNPKPAAVNAGQSASFGIIATGSKPFTYLWQKNSSDLSGATDSSYTIPAAGMDDSGSTFRCIVRNPAGADTSSAALLIVINPRKPEITTDPQSETVYEGQCVTFGVVAAGTKPLAYQWQKNSANISGATDSSYTLPAVILGDNGSKFRCIVSNSIGSDTCKSAFLYVMILDTIPPIITLLGDNPLKMGVFGLYNEPGYTAFDDINGDITNLVMVTNLVDNKKLGTYSVKYNVNDSAGNAALEKIRTVTVVDTIGPVITIKGPKVINLSTGYPYTEYGATALDAYDGDLTSKIDTAGDSVNTAVQDTYYVHYTVTDNSGNEADSVRIIIVGETPDNTPPVIALSGPNPMSLTVGSLYSEPGYTAMDNKDGDITKMVVVNKDTLNTNITGTYRVHYNVSDNAGNKDHKVRTVYVGVTGKDTVLIGTGTATGQSLPIEPYYIYTYSQSIYTKAELNLTKAIAIDSIAYYYSGTAWTDIIVVYMGTTTKSSFSSTTPDWITLTNLTQVYSGNYSVTTAGGWRKIKLNTPFQYDNVANLVIAVDENTSTYHGQDNFRCTAKTANRSLVYYADAVNPSPSSPPTTLGTGDFLGVKMYCPNIIIYYH